VAAVFHRNQAETSIRHDARKGIRAMDFGPLGCRRACSEYRTGAEFLPTQGQYREFSSEEYFTNCDDCVDPSVCHICSAVSILGWCQTTISTDRTYFCPTVDCRQKKPDRKIDPAFLFRGESDGFSSGDLRTPELTPFGPAYTKIRDCPQSDQKRQHHCCSFRAFRSRSFSCRSSRISSATSPSEW
jgi:hypothetical protein